MNPGIAIPIAILITIEVAVAILLLLGKIKIVWVRPPQPAPAIVEVEEPLFSSSAPIDVPKRKPGRPRKFKRNEKKRHLFLPTGTTQVQVDDIKMMFKKYTAKQGDIVVLHVPEGGGKEHEDTMEYPVRWSPQVKDELASLLKGWA